jgi:hypothetical protein
MLGDIFDLTTTRQPPLTPTPNPIDLRSLTSLTQLKGRVSAVYAGLFFHLFTEDQQRDLAYRVGPLLSKQPGSTIFGVHLGLPKKGFQPPLEGISRELWDGQVFSKGSVRVDAELVSGELVGYPSAWSFLQWSVVRL